MPQKGAIHDVVPSVLQRAGWWIVTEQLLLEEDDLRFFIYMVWRGCETRLEDIISYHLPQQNVEL